MHWPSVLDKTKLENNHAVKDEHGNHALTPFIASEVTEMKAGKE